jgi:hypothetical protein|tara:strand:+ start:1007 stop:1372 length:366 start_codon:yes stop_codon:yes gene_type:complete
MKRADVLKMKRADVLMANGLKTFAERRAAYGDSYIKHAKVMEAMFPDGVNLKTEVDMARWSIINLIMVKLVRYAKDFRKPHQDSIHDSGVYCFVLEELDQAHNEKVGLDILREEIKKSLKP